MMRRRTFLSSTLAVAAVTSVPGIARGGGGLAPFKLYDTHAHLRSKDISRYPLRVDVDPVMKAETIAHPITPDALLKMWDDAGVEMGCGVQFNDLYLTDNRYLLDAADRHPDRISPVIVLEPTDPATPAILKSMARAHGVSGIRFAGRPDPQGDYHFLTDASLGAWEIANELELVVVLLPIRSAHPRALPAAMKRIGELAVRYPKVNVVIDHMGFPIAENTPTFGFSPEHLALATHENVYLKHTTFVVAQLMLGGVPSTDFLDYAVDTYGAHRLIWGSAVGNNMVRFLARSPGGATFPRPTRYSDRVKLAMDSAERLTLVQKKAIFYDNAKQLFVPGGRGSACRR